MPEPLTRNPALTSLGRRLVFMVFFVVILGAVRFLFWAVVVFQFLSHAFTGDIHPNAARAGASLADYIYRIMLFLSYATEEMPFPFAEKNGFGVGRQ